MKKNRDNKKEIQKNRDESLENPTRLCKMKCIYVSSYYYVCFLILLYVSSYLLCVLILLYMCPYATTYVLMLLHVCPHTTMYVSSYNYMCPHTTIYVSSYYYVCVLILLYQFALDNNIPFLFSTQGPLKSVGPPKPANKNQVLVGGS
jgi:hypothetical protein